MSGGKVLVVDDDPEIRLVAKAGLTAQQYEVVEAISGGEALCCIRSTPYDLILFGCDMPDGVEICRKLRECGSNVALIVMTNGTAEHTRVLALDAGADSCIAKLIGMPELVARVRAMLRRTRLLSFRALAQARLGGMEIDFETRRVRVGKRGILFAPKEFGILAYLAAHPYRIVTHRELIQAIFACERGDKREALRALVHRVRGKIARLSNRPPHIFTQPRIGYRMEFPETTRTAS